MANFTCDICGGTIKMQANKTGVCQGCGMEYDLDAIRAMIGIAPANPAAVTAPSAQAPAPIPAPSASDDELSREALLCYLADVRTLETLVHEDDKAYRRLQDKTYSRSAAEKLAKNQYPDHLSKPSKEPEAPKEPQKDDSWKNLLIVFAAALIILVFILLLNVADMKQRVGRLYLNDTVLLAGSAAAFTVLAIPVFWLLDRQKRTEYEQKAAVYQQQHQQYTEAKQQYDAQMTEYSAQKETLEAQRQAEIAKALRQIADTAQEVINEKAAAEQLLKKAYAADIIPLQFRNIEGVYYLYDYLSTSKQSLSEALMQANLEAIKQKLDQMIKLQSVQIIQQAQANARLGRIMEFSEATMNNSAVAAQYAQIAAVNSAVTAKLAAYQLAYQKAEFWLK